MSQIKKMDFSNKELFLLIGLFFFLVIVQLILGGEINASDFIIGILCIVGILVVIVISKGKS